MKQRLNPQEAAEYVGVTKRTLQGLRTSGGGPRFIKAGSKTIRYDLIDLDIWIEKRKRRSTVDDGSPQKKPPKKPQRRRKRDEDDDESGRRT